MGGMKRLAVSVAAGALLVLGTATGPAEAQRTLRDSPGPAEQPPADFRGAQYVDSEGCVFIRAGTGGQTLWVPRVRRDRTLVCGARPSLQPAPAETRVAQATATTPPVREAEPVIRRQPAPAAPRDIAEPEPRVTAPAPPPVAAAPARPARAAAPRPAAPRVATQRRPAATALPVACGASELSQRYLRNTPACAAALAARDEGVAAQAGPSQPFIQTAPATPQNGQVINQGDDGDARASSRGIGAGQGLAALPPPPPGYRRAFDDGRLNPNRGPQPQASGL